MNSTSIEIRIPAAIAALPLAIGEKVVLAHIANFPGCSNTRLAGLIGCTGRGVQSLLRRLRDRGYIERSGKGRARRHHLLLHVEHNTLCADREVTASNAKSHTMCGTQPRAGPEARPKRKIAVLPPDLIRQQNSAHTAAQLLAAFCRSRC